MGQHPRNSGNQAPTRRPSLFVFLLAVAFGSTFLVRFTTGYLAPDMVRELGLGARHIGLLSAVFAFAWAATGWLLPALTVRDTTRRHWLAASVFMLALSCLGSWMAYDLYALLACRVLAGAAGGPVLPLIQSAVAQHLDPRHRGLYMGMIQGFGGSLLAAILGPLIIIQIGHDYGWRTAMLLLGVVVAACSLGLRMALPALNLVPVPARAESHTEQLPVKFTPRAATRNLTLCCIAGSLLVGWLILNTTFFPLYLSTEKHVDKHSIGVVMSWLGVGSFVGLLAVPWLADLLGRRYVLAFAAMLGTLAPWALLRFSQVGWPMLSLVFVGSLAGGCFPLVLAVVPSESVQATRVAISVGIVQAACEIAGGMFAPALLGWSADIHGIAVPLFGSLLACPLAAFVALALDETVRDKHSKPRPEAPAGFSASADMQVRHLRQARLGQCAREPIHTADSGPRL
jgi:predicted MFS family arabinose efflux permease